MMFITGSVCCNLFYTNLTWPILFIHFFENFLQELKNLPMSGTVSASELRNLSIEQLTTQLEEFREEHQRCLQRKHSHTVEADEIKHARKNITRCIYVLKEKQLGALVEEYKGKRFIPKELRPKLNKALRNELTDRQKCARVKRARIHASKYPKKIFAFVN